MQGTYGNYGGMHDVAKFTGAHGMGSQFIYGSLWVFSESAANSEKSVFFDKDLPPNKATQTMRSPAQYSHGGNLLVGRKQVCLRYPLHNCNLNSV